MKSIILPINKKDATLFGSISLAGSISGNNHPNRPKQNLHIHFKGLVLNIEHIQLKLFSRCHLISSVYLSPPSQTWFHQQALF